MKKGNRLTIAELFDARKAIAFLLRGVSNGGMKYWVLGGISVLLVTMGGLLWQKSSQSTVPSNAPEVDWRLLGEMDYITGSSSAALQKVKGTQVKIPGFMVPLEDNQRQVTEFLLVPSPQACIHVPPPPPNQMVYVKMRRGVESMQGPIWVYGTLNLSTQKSMYGDASFELVGEAVEPYK